MENTINLHDLTPDELLAMRRLLTRTYAVIHDPKHHTVGVEARNDDGEQTHFTEDDAVKFCLLGGKNVASEALGMSIGDRVPMKATELLNECSIDLYPGEVDTSEGLYPAAQVNDNLGHEAALKLLRCGVKKLRAAEKGAN